MEKAVLDYVKEHPGCFITEVMDNAGKPEQKFWIRDTVRDLLAAGKLDNFAGRLYIKE